MQDEVFMRKAIELSRLAVEHGNEPFGAVLVKNNEMVFTNENQIYTRHDPTFHGEAGLIREFCAQTGITDLQEYTMYSSCEPCFMCSGAMVWVKLGRLVYAASNMELEKILGNGLGNHARLHPQGRRCLRHGGGGHLQSDNMVKESLSFQIFFRSFLRHGSRSSCFCAYLFRFSVEGHTFLSACIQAPVCFIVFLRYRSIFIKEQGLFKIFLYSFYYISPIQVQPGAFPFFAYRETRPQRSRRPYIPRKLRRHSSAYRRWGTI